MIAQGIGHRNEIAKGEQADLSEDFFIYRKNRLRRPETFVADYCKG